MENPEIKKEWFKKEHTARFQLFCKPCNLPDNKIIKYGSNTKKV